jgi:hypothetical protein
MKKQEIFLMKSYVVDLFGNSCAAILLGLMPRITSPQNPEIPPVFLVLLGLRSARQILAILPAPSYRTSLVIFVIILTCICACSDDFLPAKITGVEYVNRDTCKIIISGNWLDNDYAKISVSGRGGNSGFMQYSCKTQTVPVYNPVSGGHILWQADTNWVPDSIVRVILSGSYSGAEFHVP